MLNNIFKNKSLAYFILYLFIGLTIVLLLSRYWLPTGFTLGGHDSGLPFAAKDFFLAKLLSWEENIGFGRDNSFMFGSLTLHLGDYISSLIGNTLYGGNWFNVFLWLSLIFSSAAFLAYSLRRHLGNYFTYIFPVFIIFNFYIAQSFFIWERAKYSIFVGILIFLTIVFKLLERKISTLLAAFLTALTFSIFNGGSLLAVSLYGNLLVVTFALIVFNLIKDIQKKDFSNTALIFRYLFLTLLFFILFNSYQLLPYLPNILIGDYITHLGSQTVSQSMDWVNYISQNTSIINLLRMQGVPNWYSNFGLVDLEHSYASAYLGNYLLIFASFLFPLFAFASYLLAKGQDQKKTILFFLILVIISLPFAAGSHAPFGFIYNFLYERVPGFFVFRNPYYKFDGAATIGFCALIAATFSMFLSKISRKVVALPLCLLVVLGWLGYHYNLLQPNKIFTWRTGYSTKFKIPSYIWDFYNWNKDENTKGERILLLPKFSKKNLFDAYAWGYWSSSPVAYALSTVPAVVNEEGLRGGETYWIERLYSTLSNGNTSDFSRLASKLGIGYLLYRKDALNQSSESVRLENFEKVRTFGEWELYKLGIDVLPEISSTNSLTMIPSEGINSTNYSSLTADLVTEDVYLENTSLDKFIDQKVKTYFCQSCLVESIAQGMAFPVVRIFPGSPFYFLKERREVRNIAAVRDDFGKVLMYLSNAVSRTSEVKSMVALHTEDKYIIQNMLKVNSYLRSALETLNNNSGFSNDYVLARRILNVVGPLITELNRYISADYYSQVSGTVREEVFSEIDNLNKIGSYFSALIPSYSYLRNNKTFYVGSETEVQFDKGEYIPVAAWHGMNNTKLTFEDTGLEEYKIKLPSQVDDSNKLVLEYDLPNTFKIKSQEVLSLPGGDAGCIEGVISNFKVNSNYEIIVQIADKTQKLSLYDSLHTKLMGIYPMEVSVPFRFVYRPDSNVPDGSLLICSQDRDIPNIVSLQSYEMISPVLEAVTNIDLGKIDNAQIEFKKINPTYYEVSATSKDPYILVLRERFSSFWILRHRNSPWYKNMFLGGKVDNHFMINGYENAWLVDKTGQTEWVLEYMPQRLFYAGSAISILTLVLSLGFVLKCNGKKNS